MGIGDFFKKPINEEQETNCEKGECLFNDGVFYYTCAEKACQRMCAAEKVSHDGIVAPELWPYMKRFEKIENSGDENFDEQADFLFDLLHELMPCYNQYYDEVGLNFLTFGITHENPVFSLLWELKDEEIFWSSHKLQALVAGNIGNTTLNLRSEFYRNPSLYLRNDFDFDYTVKLMEIVSDEYRLAEIYENIDEIGLSQFLDDAGNIKPAGIGGADKGFTGDTLWNVVESWEIYEK